MTQPFISTARVVRSIQQLLFVVLLVAYGTASGGTNKHAPIEKNPLSGTWKCVDVKGEIKPKMNIPGLPNLTEELRKYLVGASITYKEDGTFTSTDTKGSKAQGKYQVTNQRITHSNFVDNKAVYLDGTITQNGNKMEISTSKSDYLSMISKLSGTDATKAGEISQQIESMFDINGLSYVFEKVPPQKKAAP